MAIRNIVKEGDDILTKVCRPVEKFDDKLGQMLDDMAETMYQADGVGLAAPQVGVLKRVVVIDVGEGLVELINPEILETSGTQTGSEGCLSYPNEFGIVTRPNKVKVKAYDRNGNAILVKGKELMARALCHEIDHLNGVVFKDLATEMVRE